MRAGLRLGIAVLTAGLLLGPAAAFAQNSAQTTTAPAPTETVGPRELQNFSLEGTVTRPAEPAPVQRVSQRPPAARGPAVTRSTPTRAEASSTNLAPPRPSADAPVARAQSQAPAPIPAARPRPQPSSSVTLALPPIDGSAIGTPSPSDAAETSAALSGEAQDLTAGRLPLWPWLLAALALGAGGAFLLWRNRTRAYAGGPQFDAFVTPEPAPATRPAPAPPKAAPMPPSGVVSTRLRPWIDLSFQPLRCVVEDLQVTIEFELSVYNSGSVPARAVLVEATMFNAGPAQDQAIAGFFANPAGQGDRIAAIAPLKHVTVRTKVVAPRETVQLFEIGGRQVFVPLIAFNALYRWSSGDGQTSASYLLGRDTKGTKLAPFRVDLGPRVFRAVGARLLPTGLRN